MTLPATASDSDGQAEYLDELNAIAGQSVEYTPVPGEAADEGAMSAKAVELDPFECNLYPSKTHLRKSGGYGTVGAKPYTICEAGKPTSISQTSTLYIVEWAGLSYKAMQTKSKSNHNASKLEQLDIAWSCKNWNNSVFQQKTDGVSVQRGKAYYASVSTVRNTWGCGY
jgi:hypothetical protein